MKMILYLLGIKLVLALLIFAFIRHQRNRNRQTAAWANPLPNAPLGMMPVIGLAKED